MGIPDFLNTKLPLLSLRAWGAWKKTKIFQVIKGKQFIRTYSEYDGSAKGHLIPFQSKFAAAVAAWQTLPYTERRFYISRAAKLGLRISGYNYFISLYLQDKLEDNMAYPEPHKESHEKDGDDEINVSDLTGTMSEAEVNALIAIHAGLPFTHPHRRLPPQKYIFLPIKSWDLTLSTNTPKGMCFDGKNIYFQQYGLRPNFFEVDIITGAITDRSHPTNESNILNLIYDGAYVWMCRSSQPVQLRQFDPEAKTWELFTSTIDTTIANCVMSDGVNIWVGTLESPGTYHKFNPTTETWTSYALTEVEAKIRNMCFDGSHIWMGLQEPYEGIVKMDPSDGSYTMIALDTGDAGTEHLVFDGTWIWAVCDTNPTRVKRIDPVTLTHTTITLAAGNSGPRSMVYDGKSIWIGQKPQANVFVQLNPTDNSYRAWGLSAGEERCYAIGFDGMYIWGGLDGTQKKLIRFTKTR